MGSTPPDKEAKSTELPAPEVLRPQAEKQSASNATPQPVLEKPAKPLPRRTTYRPSHKGTFIGLAVMAVVLTVNAAAIYFVMRGQETKVLEESRQEVTLDTATLDKLGVNRNTVGDKGTELVVGPDARFNGKLTVSKDVNIGGQLNLNGNFRASQATFAKLQAGNVSVNKLGVNGDISATTLALRQDLSVAGVTRLQGPVTMSELLTVNNNLNVSGNLAVGGLLSSNGFQANSLVSGLTLTIGGHIITRGSAPGVSAGDALGNNGTVSISGNDAAGTVAANVGTGAGSGIVAYVTFRQPYASTPRIVVTAVGRGVGSLYTNRNANGFSIGVDGSIPPGGYVFDYIVMQ